MINSIGSLNKFSKELSRIHVQELQGIYNKQAGQGIEIMPTELSTDGS